jgi:L-amino acid N-acyltransferase YncA
LLIRDATQEDWDAIWPFFHEIVAAGETYAYDPDMDEGEGRRIWMVDPRHSGRGTGRALGEDMLEWTRASGFRAVQFNAVVETNEGAVKLWRSLGFEVLATVPEAFKHPTNGYVGLLIMHRFL